MKKILIVGATSGIGEGLVKWYAGKGGVKIGVIGRREDRLKAVKSDYPDVCEYEVGDVIDRSGVEEALERLVRRLGGMDLLILSAGTGDLNPLLDYEVELPALQTNVCGWTAIVDWATLFFEKQGYGHLAAITSIGGLRGSGMAPAYNASKAYQMIYLEGIRQRVYQKRLPVIVTDIRPGFVDTAMAKGEGLFWVVSVEKACEYIGCALECRSSRVYVGRRWRMVAWLLKHLPEMWYLRMGRKSD